jgi:hypothetical protein
VQTSIPVEYKPALCGHVALQQFAQATACAGRPIASAVPASNCQLPHTSILYGLLLLQATAGCLTPYAWILLRLLFLQATTSCFIHQCFAT